MTLQTFSRTDTGQTRHGVSPIIGALVLVALVIVVAGLMTGWLTAFTQDQVGSVKDDSDTRIQCAYAGLTIQEAVYYADREEVDVTVRNSGTVDLGNVTLLVLHDAVLEGTGFITNLEAGGAAKTGTVIYKKGQQPDSARARSTQCPDVTDEETTVKER